MFGKRPYTSRPLALANAVERRVVRDGSTGRAGRASAITSMNRPIAVEDLAQRLPAKARLIGVDLGTKTIGLALSDVERRLASPLKTLPRTRSRRTPTRFSPIFAEFEIAAIVLGLPLDLEGRTARARSRRGRSPATSRRGRICRSPVGTSGSPLPSSSGR